MRQNGDPEDSSGGQPAEGEQPVKIRRTMLLPGQSGVDSGGIVRGDVAGSATGAPGATEPGGLSAGPGGGSAARRLPDDATGMHAIVPIAAADVAARMGPATLTFPGPAVPEPAVPEPAVPEPAVPESVTFATVAPSVGYPAAGSPRAADPDPAGAVPAAGHRSLRRPALIGVVVAVLGVVALVPLLNRVRSDDADRAATAVPLSSTGGDVVGAAAAPTIASPTVTTSVTTSATATSSASVSATKSSAPAATKSVKGAPVATATTTKAAAPATTVPADPSIVLDAYAGLGCSSASSYASFTRGANLSGWVTGKPGGYSGNGCNGRYDSLPLTGGGFSNDRFIEWWFEEPKAANLTCQVRIYIPKPADSADLAAQAQFAVIPSRDDWGTVARFTVDERAAAGSWVEPGSWAADSSGRLAVKLLDGGSGRASASAVHFRCRR